VLGLKSKSAPREEAVAPAFFVVYRGPHGNLTSDPIGRDLAFEKLDEFVAKRYPTHGGRRLIITGPDYCVQPDDVDDPLLIGDAALRATLTPAEYEAYVLGPTAEAVLLA
jgi:hypothetical protein